MKILITGAAGFVGKNLTAALENIRDGKDRVHKIKGLDKPSDLVIYKYDISSSPEDLDTYCRDADFVFNLAGVNRPKDPEEFMKGNFGFGSKLLETLKKYGNKAPVMLSSSIQASLEGRYAGSEYGKSKLAGEELFRKYSEESGARVLIYRFPNLFGKWCRPNYNSAVATFSNNIANGLPMGGVLIAPKFKPVYGQLGTTFGGNHLACAAALAVLDVIEQEHLVENAAQVGKHLIERIKALQLPHVIDVRGEGLMIGIELDVPYKEIRNRLLFEEHCFTGCSGTNVLRLLPPLSLSMQEADDFLQRLDRAAKKA